MIKIRQKKKISFHNKIYLFINRKKTNRLLSHLELNDVQSIYEDKKSIFLQSKDGFETQIGKKSIWYSDKQQEKNSQAKLKIGKATYIQDCKIGPFWDNRRVDIGSFCSFGPGVDLRIDGVRGKSQFTSYPLELIDKNSKIYKQTLDKLKNIFLKIGNDVFIGENVKIMQNVTIEDGVIIGARSIIPANKKLEAYGVYAGMPAKLVKYRFDKRIVDQLLKLKWWEYSKEEIVAMGLQNIDFEEDIENTVSILEQLNNKLKK